MTNITPKPFIELEDIQVNREYWNQKISVISFTDENGKPFWNKHYNFIPHWQRYNKAVKWIKETEFPEYDCRIVKNENNEIEIVTQNYFGTIIAHEQDIQWIIRKIQQEIYHQINGLDPDDNQEAEVIKDLETILTFKTYQEFTNNTSRNGQVLNEYNYLYEDLLEQLKSAEIKKEKLKDKDLNKEAYDFARPDLAILWRKQLYFVDTWKYIDNWKLSVQIKVSKCALAVSYPTWLNTSGMGTLEQGPVIKLTSDNFEDNQRMHYDFCQDLGIKKIYQGAFTSYQPKFHLFRILPINMNGGTHIGWSEQVGEKTSLSIPYNVGLKVFDKDNLNETREWWKKNTLVLQGLMAISSVTGAEGPTREAVKALITSNINLMVGPAEMVGYGKSYYSNFEQKEEILFPNNPTFTNWLKNQPHLLDHTTFQFYFFNKIGMSANGRYLGVKFDKEKDRFVLPYKMFINCAPGALYYRWEFQYINVKLEISTQGNFQDYTNPMRFMKGFNVSVLSFGMGMNWDTKSADQAGKMEFKEDPLPEQDAHTERMFKSTFKDSLDRSVEPAMFNANTIDFNYSLGEFFNRLTDPIWFYRVDISELLYNNLCWANNKSPILNLPYQWKELGSWAQKEGFYKWKNVYLESDYQEFWKQRMEQGYLLTSDKELTNPNLNFSHAGNYIQIGGNAWNINQAEEDFEEVREPIRGQDATGGDTVVPESTAVYIRKSSYLKNENSGDDYLPQIIQLISEHMKRTEDSSNWYFWHDRNSGERSIPLPEGNYSYRIIGYNSESQQADNQPANRAIINLSGTNLTVRVEGEKITRKVKIKPVGKTINQEIDQAKLETEIREEITENMEQENREEMLRELDSTKEKETEPTEDESAGKEKEGETEEEKKEKEQEKETEKEKETETEKETEKEKEKEREKERERLEAERLENERKEQEKKERENEGEDENE